MRMVFHLPQRIGVNGRSASGIRPVKMMEAFRKIGYQVDIISGSSYQRKIAIKKIKMQMRSGVVYDFVYSESSTMPTALTDVHHLPVRPFLDFGFFRFCRRLNVPVLLFYRDIYWRFPNYGRELSFIRRKGAMIFYWLDLLQYRMAVNLLFLPSLRMRPYVPVFPKRKMRELPPGCIIKEKETANYRKSSEFRILYVGGVGAHYRLDILIGAIAKISGAELVICTRIEEWAKFMESNPHRSVPKNVKIVHSTGMELERLYEDIDICSLVVEPQEYWSFAAPMKLFEYIGHGKPVIASRGTFAGDFVMEQDIGWTVSYDIDSVTDMLNHLIVVRESVDSKAENATRVAMAHTWNERAHRVAISAAKERSLRSPK